MNFKWCQEAKDKRDLIADAIKDKWPEAIEKVYEKKLNEIRFERYQEAFDSDQAWTHPVYFELWYEKFRLRREWFFDPCLERRFWSASSYFNALIETWGEGLIFLNHSWKTTRGFFPMMLK
jgi:hypothetical protein